MRLVQEAGRSEIRNLKNALRCLGCGSKHTIRTKSPLGAPEDEEGDAEDTWLLGTHMPGLANLPEDVMLSILDCFPDKQQAVQLRAVCKAWRDAFNSTVRTIAIHSNLMLLPQSASVFPNLCHICISQTNSSAAQAVVRVLGLPNSSSLTMLEISNASMHEPPPELHHLTRLRTLSITNCRLKTLKGCKLHLLPKLDVLDLSQNNLEELPSAVGSLGTLRKLNVSDNCLAYLPEGLGGLTGLQSLRASHNTLTELPDSLIELVHLTTLDLSLNRLKSLPERLVGLTNLQQLGLFAAFSHSLRNEGSSTVGVLAQLSLAAPDMRLHAEEAVLGLVRLRKKQLKMAAAVEEAQRAADTGSGQVE